MKNSEDQWMVRLYLKQPGRRGRARLVNTLYRTKEASARAAYTGAARACARGAPPGSLVYGKLVPPGGGREADLPKTRVTS